jgi:hypothetical protein
MEESGSSALAGGLGLVVGLLYLAVIVLMIASMWKVFTKAGQPGWASIVPIYNGVVLMEIAGKPGWWVLLMFVPVVNIIINIIAMIGLSEEFGKGGGFAVGLIFLPVIFLPILAFGDAQYQAGSARPMGVPGAQPPPYRAAGR